MASGGRRLSVFSLLGLIPHPAPPIRRRMCERLQPGYHDSTRSCAYYRINRGCPENVSNRDNQEFPNFVAYCAEKDSDCSSKAPALLNSSAVASLRFASVLRSWDHFHDRRYRRRGSQWRRRACPAGADRRTVVPPNERATPCEWEAGYITVRSFLSLSYRVDWQERITKGSLQD